MSIKVNVSNWLQLSDATRKMRQDVFEIELGIPPELENDHLDEESLHYSLTTSNGELLAIARLTLKGDQAKISRLGVSKAHRGKGIGLYLGSLLMKEALRKGANCIFLTTPENMTDFCNKLGFFTSGKTYQTKTGNQIEMVNFTPSLITQIERAKIRANPHFILSKDSSVHPFSTSSLLQSHTIALFTQAKRRIYCYSHSLEHAIYDNQIVRDTLSHLTRQNDKVDIRFLVMSDQPIVQKQHRIAELYRRIPSLFQIRVINKQAHVEEDFFTLIDRDGIIYGKDQLSHQGFACYHDPGQVRRQEQKFSYLWENAKLSKEFRVIGI